MATAPVSNATSGVTLQDFLRILTAQLQYQDPLEPMNNQEFIGQIAQFTQLEQTRQLNERIDSLVQLQATTQSIGLIGKSVDVNTESGAIAGQVTALGFQNGEPRLTVRQSDGTVLNDIRLSQVSQIR